MAISILSWNIKALSSCVQSNGNHLAVIKTVMHQFDVICIYEVSNSENGKQVVGTLVSHLNKIGGRTYNGFLQTTGGLGKENDQVAVLYETGAVSVTNTTNSRRPKSAGGRQPVYFDVTEIQSGKKREFCAWHAPEPGKESTQLISQGWQYILKNAAGKNDTCLTALILGDFNAELTVLRRSDFEPLLTKIQGTTLKSGVTTSFSSVDKYLTTNVYDQFYRSKTLISKVEKVGLYNIISKLAANEAPFTDSFGRSYNTFYKAYQFYCGISDHLPIGLVVTF